MVGDMGGFGCSTGDLALSFTGACSPWSEVHLFFYVSSCSPSYCGGSLGGMGGGVNVGPAVEGIPTGMSKERGAVEGEGCLPLLASWNDKAVVGVHLDAPMSSLYVPRSHKALGSRGKGSVVGAREGK